MNKKTLIAVVIGIFLLCISSCIVVFIFLSIQSQINITQEKAQSTVQSSTDTTISPTVIANQCDDTTSDYNAFHGVEKLIVSKNPCETMWLLAKLEEEYTLIDPAGNTIYVSVWRDYENNVTASNTFTIRALDVLDTNESRNNATISIIRWVASPNDLAKAKNEIKTAVNNL